MHHSSEDERSDPGMKMSSEINELAKALAKVQSEMGAVAKGSDNPYFKSKYADLAACWGAVAPLLTKNGLSVVQTCDEPEPEPPVVTTVSDERGREHQEVEDRASVIIETILMHQSGQWIAGRLKMTPAKNTPQGIGSCITYARRYALMAITGLVADEDDDGNAASTQGKGSSTKSRSKKPPTIVDRARGVFLRAKENGMKQDAILAKMEELTGKKDPKDFTEDEMKRVEEWAKFESTV